MRPLERIRSRSPFLGILRWNRLVDRTNGLICPRQFGATKYRCESELQRNFVARLPNWTAVSYDLPSFFLVKSLAQPLLSQRWLNRLIDDPQFHQKPQISY